jgi:hypothetical protein
MGLTRLMNRCRHRSENRQAPLEDDGRSGRHVVKDSRNSVITEAEGEEGEE